jgi:hypothetical protein
MPYCRGLIIKIHKKAKRIGFHLSLLTILSTIAVYQKSGLSTEKTLLQVDFVQSLVKVYGVMKKDAANGGQFLFLPMIRKEISSQESGTTTIKNTVNLPESTFFLMQKTLGFSPKG